MKINGMPKLRQSFDFTYEYKQNDTVIICYARPREFLAFLNEEPTSKRKIYKGVAVLKQGDLPCINEGREIAKRKAMRSYYKDMRNKYEKFYYLEAYINWRRALFTEQFTEKINQLSDEIKKIAYSK